MLRNQFLSQGCLIKIIRAKTFFTRSTLATFLRPTFDPKVKHQTSLSEPLLAADTTAASIIGGGSGGGLPACRLLQTFNETDIKGKRFDDNSAPGLFVFGILKLGKRSSCYTPFLHSFFFYDFHFFPLSNPSSFQ